MYTIDKLQNKLSNEIKNTFKDCPEGDFKIVLEYATSIQGKLIRPLLFLTLLDALNEEVETYIDVAIAIELVHMHSLIFDDMPMMDDDDYRRGQLTLHKQFNEYSAALAGLNILTTAWKKVNQSNIDNNLKVKLADILINATNENGIMLGQFLDLSGQVNNQEEILYMYSLKTGALIEAPILMAELACKKQLKDFSLLAQKLGIVFQLQDDYLEATTSSEILGKSNSSDLENNKKTFVAMYGLENTKIKVEQLFDEIESIIISNNLNNTAFDDLVNKVKNREW